MSELEDFLSAEEEAEIVEAIKKAEKATSGEIRVHLENNVQSDPMEHAKEIFQRLEMHQTKARNGVLIYLAVHSKVFAILGDKGINDVVPEGFWDSTKDVMQSCFKKGEFKEGIEEGIKSAGDQLKKFFPWNEDDRNELPDQITKS